MAVDLKDATEGFTVIPGTPKRNTHSDNAGASYGLHDGIDNGDARKMLETVGFLKAS